MSLFGCCDCSELKSEIRRLEKDKESIQERYEQKKLELEVERAKICKKQFHSAAIGSWNKYPEVKPEPGHQYIIWTQNKYSSYDGMIKYLTPSIHIAHYCCTDEWYKVIQSGDKQYFRDVVYWAPLPEFPGER